ncbi:MAG: MerR family transcriptional regulator [Acidobacteria bacterium]|nr:MerR family transcriptional regulator [Acidobacteriota bacterium]MBW4045618.1 MerR family transcriptional regulator [Acidobacteriota bacterium]
MTRHAAQRGADGPSIPDKLYFRIGEVARLCEVETYVLRFWETEFPQLKPNKGGTGQRLYRKRDVEMALRIKRLLHDEGYTIAGARQVFSSETRDSAPRPREPELTPSRDGAARDSMPRLERVRLELRDILQMLSNAPGHAARREHKTRRAGESTKDTGPTLFGI